MMTKYICPRSRPIFPCFSQLVRSCSNTMININQTDYWCNLNAIAESAEAVLLQARPRPRHHRLDSWDCLPCPHPPQPVHVCIDCPAPSLTVSPSPKLRNGGFSFFCHFSFENASTCLYIYSIYNITYLQYLLIIYQDRY